MTKPEWRTYSIRVNPKRKAVALQARFPLTEDEYQWLMSWLEYKKPELVERNPE